MTKIGRPPRDTEDISFYAFPILAALVQRPMSARELYHALLMSKASIYRRLRQLEKQNLVAQRIDRKWIPLVVLRMEKPPEIPAYPEEKVPPGAPEGPKIIGPPSEDEFFIADDYENDREGVQEPAGGEFHSVPDLHPRKDQTPYRAPEPPPDVNPQSLKIAKHFRVPAVRGEGQASMGQMGQCACGKPTPLKYGAVSICPIHARE